MIATRFLALAAAAFGLVQAQSQPPQSPSRLVLDDIDAPWKYPAGASRVADSNEEVAFGGYTVVPAGAGATEVTFSGSGIALWFAIPPGAGGPIEFYLDGQRRLTYDIFAWNETLYNWKVFSKHKLEIKEHTVKIVSDSVAYGVDVAIYNPGAPASDDPTDE
ncbi:hypothetical protein AURDEDRAFT_127737 [Auricularia subglabra TFB-10046 SS5]|nr:hypothetical protein AURDEDRAFT_127737 [Auricularia subglabra TFB-10046 SS5]